MGAGGEANHLPVENICRFVDLVASDTFDDETDRCGKDVKHFTEWQPGQKGQGGKDMQIPEYGYCRRITNKCRERPADFSYGKTCKGSLA